MADSVHKSLLSKQSIRSVSSLFNEKKLLVQISFQFYQKDSN